MNYQYGDFEPSFGSSRFDPSGRRQQRSRRKLRSLLTKLVLLAALVVGLIGIVAYLDVSAPAGPKGEPQVAAATPAATAKSSPATENAPNATVQSDSAGPTVEKVADIGDWAVFCPTPPNAQTCFIQQRLASQGGQTAFLWTIYVDDKGTYRAVWQTPSGVDAHAGMGLDLGGGQSQAVPFEGCDDRSCSVRAVLTPAYLDQIKSAASVTALVMASSSKQVVRFQLSSRGLAEALARI